MYLEQLGFHQCNVSKIPEKINRMKDLKSFYIHCSIDCEIPESFGELTQLEELGFFDTNIYYQAETFAQLNSLRHLDLRGISLDHYRIPHTIGELSNLKILNISNKQSMHYTFAEPPNLVIPDFVVNINSLEELYCEANAYHLIPDNIDEMKNLKILDLSSNKIEILPESLQECKKLEELNLQGNPLKTIPEWFYKMNLKRFDLTKSILNRDKMSEDELSKLKKGTISERIFKNGFLR